MAKDNENQPAELHKADRALFSSLLKHVVQATHNEDPTDFVLSSFGRNIGADRCYVYRFWEPGKSSMCTNTHEWCAEGIKPEIDGQQSCNLADLVEFNARITSGQDFLFTDIDAISAGSREWLEPQGIKSLIATPLIGADNVICGFAGFDFVKAPCKEFTDRIIDNIHEVADLLLNCQSLHERDMAIHHELTVALNMAHLKGDVVEFMFKHKDYAEVRDFIGRKVCEMTGAQHLLLCSDAGSRSDWFGPDAPPCCHDCAKAAVNFGRRLPTEFFSQDEMVIVHEGETLPDMNLPHYCPMKSSAVSQFKRDKGWWRLVADYTKPHKHNLTEVARGMHAALELLAIAYDRERHDETIAEMQEHQRYRADMLAYALSKDDIPGLIDMMLHRLLEMTACDYIALHNVDGDHLMLHPGGQVESCPKRCMDCSFYKLNIPDAERDDHIIELDDTAKQVITDLSPTCPAKSLEVVIVYREGKPWGGIALHYLNRQREISEDDRRTLKIAADVLTLALERHAAAVRLEAERDRVVEAEKARSYFFSSVSHDIRTPLNAIIGFSELLQAGNVPPEEAKQDLKMIVASGKTLLQLVNDILDLSKMDMGKLEFSPEPTDIGDLVREIMPVFRPMTTEKKQTVVLDIPDIPHLMIDPHRLRQVLFNFVSNAVKYAGPCTIRVSVGYAGGMLKLEVADNGVGVSAEKAKRLMQPFVQADIKNRTEGSGLGLAICKRLVEIVHGTISIETAPGKGFAIHVEAPVKLAPSKAKKEASASADVKKQEDNLPSRILVVDDSPMNRLVLKAMLKQLNITDVELAEDGKAALEKLESEQPFDFVLSDMWMPVMDGAELVKRIRADERLAHLKVCSITADVEARTTYREQGFDSLLLKPVTMEKLLELFRSNAS